MRSPTWLVAATETIARIARFWKAWRESKSDFFRERKVVMLKRSLIVATTVVVVLLAGCAGTGYSGGAADAHAGHAH